MKKVYILTALLFCGLFYANAQDLIILRDGTVTEARDIVITQTEIRYRRVDETSGNLHIIPLSFVLSVRYEDGTVWVAGSPVPVQPQPAAPLFVTPHAAGDVTGEGIPATMTIPQALIAILNSLPAIPVAGNNLKFMFTADSWIATVNGENFSQGTIEYEAAENGGILTLKQTHIYPGAMASSAGRLASRIPGAGQVAGALDAAGQVAGGLMGAVEAPGPQIILEYNAGPPPSMSLLAFRNDREGRERRRGGADGEEPDRAWARRLFYFGAALGGGESHESGDSIGGYWYYDPYYNYSYWVYEEDNESSGAFALGVTSEFALLPFLQLEASLLFGSGFGFAMPLLLRLGGKIPIGNGGMEISGDFGYTVGYGTTLGATLGFNAGPGILYFRGLYSWSRTDGSYRGLFLILAGYKWGVGAERGRRQ